MASAAAFLFFLVTKESVGGWDWRPHLSWSLYGVTLSGDRMSVVSPPLLSPPYPGGPEVTGHWFILFSFLFPFPQF